jgi:hypothetical protein
MGWSAGRVLDIMDRWTSLLVGLAGHWLIFLMSFVATLSSLALHVTGRCISSRVRLHSPQVRTGVGKSSAGDLSPPAGQHGHRLHLAVRGIHPASKLSEHVQTHREPSSALGKLPYIRVEHHSISIGPEHRRVVEC